MEEALPVKRINDLALESFLTEEKSQGRKETRLHVASDIPDELIDYTFAWKELKKIGMAVSFRTEINDDKKEPEMQVRYYIISADLDDFVSGNLNDIPNQFRSMKRLWVGKGLDGLIIRREDEAKLFEEGLSQ